MKWLNQEVVRQIRGILVLVVVSPAILADDAVIAERRKLEGTWQLVSAVTDGKPAPESFVSKVQVVIRDGKHTVMIDGKPAVKEIPVILDLTTAPKSTIDILPDGQKIYGIYEFEDDRLTSCVASPGQERPKSFVSEPGSGHTLRVFQRVK